MHNTIKSKKSNFEEDIMTIKFYTRFEFSQKIFSPVQFEIECIVSISSQCITNGCQVMSCVRIKYARIVKKW